MSVEAIKKKIEKSLPPTRFQEPIEGYLGVTSETDAEVIAGISKVYVRLYSPDSPEYEIALVSPNFMSYYASLLRPNLKIELIRTKRGDLKIHDIDVYAEIANFSGVFPQPNIIVDVGADTITGILAVDHGGSGADLSATGDTTHFVRQASTGAVFTVGAIVNADVPNLSGKTISSSTFTGDTVSDYLAFTEASTPSSPANTAARLYARDVLTWTRMGYVDSTGLIIDISRDRTIEVNNATGVTISALRVCRVNGASGSTPFQPTITPAQGNSAANADGILGVTIASITNGSNGRVMLHGLLSIDTSALALGAVYIDPSTAGVLTTTKPTSPNVARRVGWVLRANVSGLILIDPGELDANASASYSVFTGASAGVAGSTGLVPQPTAGQQNRILTGDGTWKSTMDSVTIGGTTPAGAKVTTFETTGAVIFNEAGNDVDFRVEGDNDANLLFLDASTDRLGIGTNAPDAKLQIVGDVSIGNNTAATTLSIKPSATGLAAIGIGTGRTGDGIGEINFYANSGATADAYIRRDEGADGVFRLQNEGLGSLSIVQNGAAPIAFLTTGLTRMSIAGGGDISINTNLTIAQYLALTAGSNAGNSRLWQDSADKMPVFQTAQGMYFPLSGRFWAMLTAVTSTSTSYVQMTTGTADGSLQIPASQLVAGSTLVYKFWGHGVATAGNLFWEVRLNGTAIYAFAVNRTVTSDETFSLEIVIQVRSAGSSGSAIINATSNGLSLSEVLDLPPTSFTINTTIADTFDLYAIWGNSPTGQSVTIDGAMAVIY